MRGAYGGSASTPTFLATRGWFRRGTYVGLEAAAPLEENLAGPVLWLERRIGSILELALDLGS